MRAPALCVLFLAAAAAPLAAQGQHDTVRPSKELRERIEHRFAERVKQELDLSDEQAGRLKTIAKEYGGRRKQLRHRERDLRAALEAQIGGGAASDQDSVARLTRELLDLRLKYAESWREEMGKLSFLTPVQQARLLVMRERLIQRVHEMRGDHRGFRHHGDGH